MNYSLPWLLERIDAGERFDYLHFYSHQPTTTGIVDESCYSQWFPAEFIVDEVTYLTAEHYMMAAKARLFDDAHSLAAILQSKTPKEAKALGRSVKGFDREVWQENCYEIVVQANTAKFAAHENLREWLVSTAPRVLVEASPTDAIWGIGMTATTAGANDPRLWQGRNLLGFALMTTRDSLSR